ncbi:MAG: citD2 [Caloramator sp.]|jgi:citrate lyase subunit gamma (acyl carrier protein)|uniref:citrate lyase acyl carrier protein n=1 Tax=Caloramator sp. TaxID=1871330 RepID=UPI001E168447|nr:citrate lyase acyl carrier protein [Caloramator sp.]MBZ4663538.1 citD2 [Caloramator sp.]
MKIKRVASAGTLESSDILVVVEPNLDQGIVLELKSVVEKQYGEQIKKVIIDTLAELGIRDAIVKVNDKGALDCVIKARVQTAVFRATEKQNLNWEEVN